MKKKRVPCLLLLLSVFSCFSCGNITPSDNPLIIDHNGEIFSTKSATSNSYETVCRNESASYIASRINAGEQALVLSIGHNCSHCIKDEPYFVSYALETEAEIFLADVTDSLTIINQLENYFPAYKDAFDTFGTPAIFYMRSPTEIEIADIYSDLYSASALANRLNAEVNQTDVYRFSTYASYGLFASWAANNSKDILTVFVDENEEEQTSFFSEEIRTYQKEGKPIAFVSTNSLSEEDVASFESYYHLDSLLGALTTLTRTSSLEILATSDYLNKKEEAVSLVSSFFD